MAKPSEIIGQLQHSRIYSLQDLEALGLSRQAVNRYVQQGELVSPASGLFHSNEKQPDINDDLALVAKRYPDAVVALYTAAKFHEITQNESGIIHVFYPIERRRALGMGDRFWLDITTHLTTSSKDLTVGIDTHEVSGVQLKITSPERTIADMWRQSALGTNIGNRQLVVTDEDFYQALGAYLDKNDERASPLVETAVELGFTETALSDFTKTLTAYTNGLQSKNVY